MIEAMLEIEGILIFDSWLENGPELRSGNGGNRHLIYEGGGIILDLLLRQARNGACLHIGGQVLPGDQSHDSVSDLEVSMEHGELRSRTHTNALGEFTFHAVPGKSADISIRLRNRKFRVRGLGNHEPRMWKVVPSLSAGGD